MLFRVYRRRQLQLLLLLFSLLLTISCVLLLLWSYSEGQENSVAHPARHVASQSHQGRHRHGHHHHHRRMKHRRHRHKKRRRNNRHKKQRKSMTHFGHDCHPDQGISPSRMKQNCKSRGCLWSDGRCFYPKNYANYQIVESNAVLNGKEIILKKTKRGSGFKRDIKAVKVTLTGSGDNVLDIRMQEFVGRGKESRCWSPHVPALNLENNSTSLSPKWIIKMKGPVIQIQRRTTGRSIFQFNLQSLIFSDQFLQLVVKVPANSLYGLGERLQSHRKSFLGKERKLPFYNYRVFNAPASYGSHPFYLMYENRTNDAHGVLFFNSNPSDITLMKDSTMTYRTIGGDLRFLLFLGPDPIDVIRQKAKVIGHSPLPPYWSLGFHLSREIMTSVHDLRSVLVKNIKAGIPIDGLWLDIFYLEKQNTFAIDKKWSNELKELADQLHQTNRSLVPIVNMDFAVTRERRAGEIFARGMEMDVFMKNKDNKLMKVKNRNAVTVLPDFTHPNISVWWTNELQMMHNELSFDGIWLDTNEPSTRDYEHRRCPHNQYDRPQYNPVYPRPMEQRTVCLSARHANGRRHYDVHNMYGLLQSMHTFHALKTIRPHNRPFILSRSTTTGSGSYAAHWTGDINSKWEDMRRSISSILDFNIFGIPFTGADICGFRHHPSVELCARWHALGAFYTFSRNHNGLFKPQDPVSMGPIVVQSAKKNLRLRYELLPFLYTLFYPNSLTGEPVVRSLKMNFPSDEKTDGLEGQFMWGYELLITPVLVKGKTEVSAYFPAGVWYDYQNGMKISDSLKGETITLKIPVTDISLAVRGGSVIPVKKAANVRTTADHQILPFSLVVALDAKGEAEGLLYWDDGDGLETIAKKEYLLVRFQVRDNSLTSTVINSHPKPSGNTKLRTIRLLGAGKLNSANVTHSGTSTGCRVFNHESKRGSLIALPEEIDLRLNLTISWAGDDVKAPIPVVAAGSPDLIM